MSADQHLQPEQFKSYTKHYNAGWRHSSTAARPNPDNASGYAMNQVAKGHADDRHFAEDAWEDGYMDAAVGREKFALRGHRFGTKDLSEWGY